MEIHVNYPVERQYKAIGISVFMAAAESINFDSFFVINSTQYRQHEFVLFCHRLYNSVSIYKLDYNLP